MRTGAFSCGALLGCAAIVGTPSRIAEAHEKWFLEAEAYSLQVREALADPRVWLAIGGPIVLWAVAMVLWQWRQKRSFVPGPGTLGGRPEAREGLYAFMPLVLAVHLGVPLLVNGLNHTLFAPNNDLEGVWAHLLTLGQIGVALGLFYGTPTRVAALFLALMWGVGLFVVGVEPMLEAIHILGFSAFFYCAGRGPGPGSADLGRAAPAGWDRPQPHRCGVHGEVVQRPHGCGLLGRVPPELPPRPGYPHLGCPVSVDDRCR